VSRRVRRSLLSVFAALAVVVGAAALAWACTPQAYLYLSPSSIAPSAAPGGTASPAGATVTVTGKGFVPGPVAIHLDSGPALATATGPDFSIQVQLPAMAAGVHYLRGVAYQPDGVVAGDASRALLVRAAPTEEQTEAPPPQPAAGRDGARSRRQELREPRSTRREAPAHEPSQTAPRQVAPAPRQVAPAPRQAVPPPRQATRPDTAASVASAADRPATTPRRDEPAAKPKQAVRRAAVRRALPSPLRAAPATGAPRDVWAPPGRATSRAPRGPAASDPSWARIAFGLALIGLAIVGLGGAGVALVRSRSRRPAPGAATATPLPPDPDAERSSLDAELERLLAEDAPSPPPGEREPALR